MSRNDGRGPQDLRPLRYEVGYLQWAEGSVLLEMGNTRVLCSASYESRVPPWLQGSGRGWVSAEYSMLPGATSERSPREVTKGRLVDRG
jgi:ribonuclease PH